VTREELEQTVRPERYVGRAPQQTEDFIRQVVQPILGKYQNIEEKKPDITV
jgi:adenylosuccinate lyase